MIGTLDIIDRLPFELLARLEADEFFADLPVLVAEEGDVQAEMKRKQAVITQKSGKRGAAVIVLQVVAEDDLPNLQFGPLTLYPAIQVVENLELNRGVGGTGKSARKIARRVRDVIKCFGAVSLVKSMQADKPCIEPVNLGAELGKLVKAYQVNFRCLEASSQDSGQVQIPQVVSRAPLAEVALTCATEGAEVWYTLDESYPAPGNDQAHLYSDPITIPEAGMTVRACGYKAGLVASWVNRVLVEIES
jgi:hypothetical protein